MKNKYLLLLFLFKFCFGYLCPGFDINVKHNISVNSDSTENKFGYKVESVDFRVYSKWFPRDFNYKKVNVPQNSSRKIKGDREG